MKNIENYLKSQESLNIAQSPKFIKIILCNKNFCITRTVAVSGKKLEDAGARILPSRPPGKNRVLPTPLFLPSETSWTSDLPLHFW